MELPEKADGVPQLLKSQMLTAGTAETMVIFKFMTADSVSAQEGILSALTVIMEIAINDL